VGFMPERPRKRPTDLNRLAAPIVDEATGNASDPDAGKNPAAVALGQLGGANRKKPLPLQADRPLADRRGYPRPRLWRAMLVCSKCESDRVIPLRSGCNA
jgi:hypothetical protein